MALDRPTGLSDPAHPSADGIAPSAFARRGTPIVRRTASGTERQAILYHLGCGRQRLDGFVNVDIQQSDVTDLVLDLNSLEDLPGIGVDGFFSHAFFEHLYRDQRVAHLRAARERLRSTGFLCYMGLPDFRRIAERYMSGARGFEGPVFDLHNVYRYTHGHPEMGGTDWLAQLHKSLFDVAELDRLLRDSGYASYVIFRYVFPGDPPDFDLSLGVYATPVRRSAAELQDASTAFLSQFDGRFLAFETLTFDGYRARHTTTARANGSMPGLALRRTAYRAACRLAQIA
jgi:predicted SAM-dependent methyltransferase